MRKICTKSVVAGQCWQTGQFLPSPLWLPLEPGCCVWYRPGIWCWALCPACYLLSGSSNLFFLSWHLPSFSLLPHCCPLYVSVNLFVLLALCLFEWQAVDSHLCPRSQLHPFHWQWPSLAAHWPFRFVREFCHSSLVCSHTQGTFSVCSHFLHRGSVSSIMCVCKLMCMHVYTHTNTHTLVFGSQLVLVRHYLLK